MNPLNEPARNARGAGQCAILLTALAASATAMAGCAPGTHDARAMTTLEKQTFVSRPPPQRVPVIKGLSSVGAQIRINASPSKVWRVLAVGFGDIDNWAGSAVSESECTSGGVGKPGAVRSCRIAKHMPFIGGTFYEERIRGWDPGNGYVSIVQTRATGPTDMLVNESWIRSDGNGGTVLTQLVHVDFRWMARMMGAPKDFKRKMVEGQIGLKHYCETGEKVTPENWKKIVKRYPAPLKDNGV